MNKSRFLTVLLCLAGYGLLAQTDSTATLKTILLEQLRTTHNQKDWFVPASLAIDGLTAEQANWKDNSGNHSIAQLTTHLLYWDLNLLDKFIGVPPEPFNGNNKETFAAVTPETWILTIRKLDSVLTAIEAAVQKADETKLQKWYSTLSHVGPHNAYHTGQIIYIRKMKGWWDDNKGVK